MEQMGPYELADRLIALRRQAGLSQEQLADRLGVTRQSVSKWESGASTPELGKLVALADLYQITLDSLIRGREAAAANQQMRRMEADISEIKEYVKGFSYTSKTKLWGIPLVCIRCTPRRFFIRFRLGGGIENGVAVGIIAIGDVAIGAVAIGGLSLGLVSLGAISLGLLALGAIAAGVLSLGALAVGYLAFGASVIAVYGGGAAVWGSRLAVGVSARSPHAAIGLEAAGLHVMKLVQGALPSPAEVGAFLGRWVPELPGFLRELFAGFFS